MSLVSRDPFGRTELHKTKAWVSSPCGCAWCGGNKTDKRNGRAYLYEFENQSDGGRRYPISRQFCSVSCMKDYHS